MSDPTGNALRANNVIPFKPQYEIDCDRAVSEAQNGDQPEPELPADFPAKYRRATLCFGSRDDGDSA